MTAGKDLDDLSVDDLSVDDLSVDDLSVDDLSVRCMKYLVPKIQEMPASPPPPPCVGMGPVLGLAVHPAPPLYSALRLYPVPDLVLPWLVGLLTVPPPKINKFTHLLIYKFTGKACAGIDEEKKSTTMGKVNLGTTRYCFEEFFGKLENWKSGKVGKLKTTEQLIRLHDRHPWGLLDAAEGIQCCHTSDGSDHQTDQIIRPSFPDPGIPGADKFL